MAMQIVQFSINHIEDANGLESIVTALNAIDGVEAFELQPENNVGMVRYDDTKTSVHAFKAAVSTVEYVTQPFPEDAPQHPDN